MYISFIRQNLIGLEEVFSFKKFKFDFLLIYQILKSDWINQGKKFLILSKYLSLILSSYLY